MKELSMRRRDHTERFPTVPLPEELLREGSESNYEGPLDHLPATKDVPSTIGLPPSLSWDGDLNRIDW